MIKSKTRILYLLFLGVVFYGFPLCLQAQTLNWDFENVATDLQESGANPDIALDSEGNMHVSFWHNLEDRLVYARREAATGTWSLEALNTNSNFHGYKSAIALDDQDKVHIAFVKRLESNAQIQYISNKTGSWEVEIPSSDTHIGKYGIDQEFPIHAQTSLDIFFQADGNPAILFFDGKTNTIGRCGAIIGQTYLDYDLDMKSWIKLSDGSWELGSFVDVPSQTGEGCLLDGDRFGEFCQMVKTSDNRYVAVTNSLHNHDMLVFSSPDLVNWEYHEIDSTRRFFTTITETHFREGFEHLDVSLVGDSSLHMVYGVSNHYGNGNTVQSRQAVYYSRVDLDSLNVPGYEAYHYQIGRTFGVYRSLSSIINHSEDSIYTCYYELTENNLVLVKSFDRGLTWEYEAIDSISTNTPVHLLIQGDSLRLLVYDSRNNQLKLLSRAISGTEWITEIATRSELRGEVLSSKVVRDAGTDEKHIAYLESVSGEVHYAFDSGSGWNIEKIGIEENADIGSLAMDLSDLGEPLLVYGDDQAEQLRVAWKQGTWNTRLIASFSMARNTQFLFENGVYHVAYFDLNTGHLHYLSASALAGPWGLTVVDSSSSIVGRGLDMAMASDGTLHLSYQDVISPKVRHAFLPPASTWQIEDITPAFNFNPNSTSIAVNSMDLVSIAFRDATSNSIQLAENDGTGWSIGAVEGPAGNLVGNPMQLIIDGKDRPWVLYNISDIRQEIGLVRRDASLTWNSVSVTSNTAEIANVFDFHLVENDFYIIGKKNQLSNNGIGVLFAQEGIRTNVSSLLSQTHLELFPNPTRNSVQIEVSNPVSQAISLELYNLEGQLIHTIFETSLLTVGDHEFMANLPKVEAGLYMLVWKGENYQVPKKLVILP